MWIGVQTEERELQCGCPHKWSTHALAAQSPGKNPGAHGMGGLVDLRASLNVLQEKKSLPLPGFEPLITQSIP